MRFTTKGFRNRFRYRFGLSHPLIKKGKSPLTLSANNELFFTDVPPYFERNRMSLTLNYKPNKNQSVQMGYLHQFDYKINDEIGKNFFLVGYYIDLFKE
jgi:long-subunit fatty acid transport protein